MDKKTKRKKRRFLVLTILLSFIIIITAIWGYFRLDYTLNFKKSVYISQSESLSLFNKEDESSINQAISTFINNLNKRNINQVYFEIIDNGKSFYNSSLIPPDDDIADNMTAGIDIFSKIVKRANNNNIKVFATFSPFVIGSDDTFVKDKLSSILDYYIYNDIYYYLPLSSKSQTYITDIIQELLNNYPLAGICYKNTDYPIGCITSKNVIEDFEIPNYDYYCSISQNPLSISSYREYSIKHFIMGTKSLLNNYRNTALHIILEDNIITAGTSFLDINYLLTNNNIIDQFILLSSATINDVLLPYKNTIKNLLKTRKNLDIKISVLINLEGIEEVLDKAKYCNTLMLYFGYTSYNYLFENAYDSDNYDLEKVKDILKLL